MPIYPGVYGEPLLKVATVQFPLVSGYATARLEAALALQQSGNPTSNLVVSGYQTVSMVVSNDGPTTATLQVFQTDNIVSGPRTRLGSAVSLVANGGMATLNFIPQAHWIEFNCTAGGPTYARAQMGSGMDWTLQGFGKLEVLYPQFLVSGNYTTPWGANSSTNSPQIVASS